MSIGPGYASYLSQMFSDTNVLNFSKYFIAEKFDTTVTYFASNFDFRFAESFFTMRRIFSSVTSGFTTQYELAQVSILHENCTKYAQEIKPIYS